MTQATSFSMISVTRARRVTRTRPSIGTALSLLALMTFCLFASTGFAADPSDDWAALKSSRIAEVASLKGQVSASDGATSRTLRLGDPVYSGERVTTTAGSSAGLWLDDSAGAQNGALAQLEGKTRARVTRSGSGGARVVVEQGAVRVVDPRDEGAEPAIELAALDTETQIRGGDREARILTEKTGPYAVLCDWDSPMTAARGGQSATSGPGGCVVGNGREPLFAAPAHSDRIPLLDGAPNIAAAGPPIDPQNLLDDPGNPLPPVSSGGPGGGGPGGGGPGGGNPTGGPLLADNGNNNAFGPDLLQPGGGGSPFTAPFGTPGSGGNGGAGAGPGGPGGPGGGGGGPTIIQPGVTTTPAPGF